MLVGGLRALGVNAGRRTPGVLTDRPGVLTNDFFVNLLDMGTEWKTSATTENVYEGRDRSSGARQVDRHRRRPASSARNSQLRAIAEVYAQRRREARSSCDDFVAAWDKVMNLDRFDLAVG